MDIVVVIMYWGSIITCSCHDVYRMICGRRVRMMYIV